MPEPLKLKCPECEYENESQRIYCHNCGAKLDRSILPQDPATLESTEKRLRRVRKAVNPGIGPWKGFFKPLIECFGWAVAVAAVIQMLRPPAGIPARPSKEELLDTPLLASEIERYMSMAQPQRLEITEDLANKYLCNAIKTKKTNDLLGAYFRFGRVLSIMREGTCWMWVEYEWMDEYRFYVGSGYNLSIRGGGLDVKNVGGYIGHLPVHPAVMEFADSALSGVWKALNRERKIVGMMESVDVHDGKITLVTKPGAQ